MEPDFVREDLERAFMEGRMSFDDYKSAMSSLAAQRSPDPIFAACYDFKSIYNPMDVETVRDALRTKRTSPQPKAPTMNRSAIIFLANDAVRAIKVSYDPAIDLATGKDNAPTYLFKSLDPAIAVDDYVVVPTDTRHGYTVCRVREVDVEAPLPTEGGPEYKWIVGRVDTAAYTSTLAMETTALDTVKRAEKRHEKEKLREKLIADNPAFAELFNGETPAPALAAPDVPGTYDDIAKASD